jgi:hypothetical protein
MSISTSTVAPSHGMNLDRRRLHVDLVMLALLLANLAVILMDLLYEWPASAALWRHLAGDSHRLFGETIHRHFLRIDGAFILLFFTEFVVSWWLSVRRREWPQWYAYGFIHWYDLLGCIPAPPFRFLRLLRLTNIVWRLHRLGLVKITEWRVYRLAHKIYEILVEEISDRVVIKVLGSLQAEILEHGLLQKGLVEHIVVPRRARLAEAVGQRVQTMVREGYAQYRPQIDVIVRELVATAVARNRDLGRIERIPMLGDFISRSIEHAIYDITGNVLAEALARLEQGGGVMLARELIDATLRALSTSGADDSRELATAAIDTLEFIKQRVAEREWLKPSATNATAIRVA